MKMFRWPIGDEIPCNQMPKVMSGQQKKKDSEEMSFQQKAGQ